MEPFFSLLQKNVLNRRPWTTRAPLRIAMVTWIERTCHRRRREARLGRLTPIEFEIIMNNTKVRRGPTETEASMSVKRGSVRILGRRWRPVIRRSACGRSAVRGSA